MIIQLLLSLTLCQLCQNCKISEEYKCEPLNTEIEEICGNCRPHIDNKCYECNSESFYYIDDKGNCQEKESCPYKIIFESNECIGHCPEGYCEFGVYCYNKNFSSTYNFSEEFSFEECQCKEGFKKNTNKYECIEHCSSNSYTYNYDKRECVTQCEDNDKKKIEIIDNIKITRCSSKCKIEEFYYKTNNSCLEDCSWAFIYENFDGSIECVDECNEDDIYNNTLNQCVKKCGQNEIILFDFEESLNKSIKHCISNDYSKFYYEYDGIYFTDCNDTYKLFKIETFPTNITTGSESQGICVENCLMAGDYKFLDEGKCVLNCSEKFHYNKICLNNCSTLNQDHDYNLNFTLVGKNNDNNNDKEKEIIIKEEDYNMDEHECLKDCPKGTYKDEETKQCYVSSCIEGKYINSSNLECINCNITNNFIYNEKINIKFVSKSQGEINDIVIRQYCLSSCPKNSPYYNYDEKECSSSKCSENKKYSAYDNPYICYNSCSLIGEYNYEKDYICYKESVGCDKDYFYYDENKVKICVDEKDCIEKNFLYIQEKQCVMNCNENYYRIKPKLNNLNKIEKLGSCLVDKDCINRGYSLLNNSDGKICNETCNLYMTYPEISLNEYNETCFEKCPNEYPYYDINEKGQKICLKYCYENKFVDGYNCSEKCEYYQYHFENSKQCVSSCEKNNKDYYYYKEDDNEEICYYSCPSYAPFVINVSNEQNQGYKYICNKTCNEDSPFYYEDLKECTNNCQLYNSNHTKCVYQCEPGEKYNDENCTDECPNTKYIIKDKLSDSNEMIVEKCVENCIFLKSNKSNYCLKECLSDEKYKYNGTCYEKCPNGTYSDEIKEECHSDKCPDGYKYYEKENENDFFKCKNSCSSAKFYLLEGGECMDSCPPDYKYIGNDHICLKNCSLEYGQYFEEYDNNTYKCIKTCDKLILNDNKKCVSNCPQDYYELSEDKICYYKSCNLFNKDYPFATINEDGINICSKKCNDSQPNYGDDYICKNGCNDNDKTPIIDYNDKCVSSCNHPYYQYQENNTCVYKCSKYVDNKKNCVFKCEGDYNYIEDNECRKSCDEPNFAEKIDNNMFKCVTKCKEDKYYYEIGNIFTRRKCFDNCLDNDFIIQDTQICCTECPSDYYSYYSSNKTLKNNTCVKKCPDDKPFIYSSQCLSECPSNQKYHLEGEYLCRVDCPTGSKIENNICKSECSDNKFLDVNNQCVDDCKKPNEYYFEASNKCTNDCGIDYYYEGKKCVKYCSENNTFINNSNCVDQCESGKYYINYTGEVIKKVCQKECPKFSYFDNTANLTICKDECEYILNKTICVDICKDDYHFYDYENRSCLYKCPENYFYIDVPENFSNNTKCYKKCPNEYPYYNKSSLTCSNECSGYLNFTSKECLDLDECITNKKNIYSDNGNKYCLNDCDDLGLFKFGNECVKNCSFNNLTINMEKKTCECQKFFYLNENNQTICTNNCEGTYNLRLIKTNQCLKDCNNYILSLDKKYCYEEESQCPQNTELKQYTFEGNIKYKCDCSYKYYKDNENVLICLKEGEECPNDYKYIREDSSECIKQCEEGYTELGNICLNNSLNYKYWYFKDNKFQGIENCGQISYLLIHNSTQCIKNCKLDNFPVYPNVNDINECLSNCEDIPNTLLKKVNNSDKSFYECECIDLWYMENNIKYCNNDTTKKTCAEAFEGKNKTYLIKETKECIEKCNENYSFSFGKECFKSCQNIKRYYGFDAKEDKNNECKCPGLWKKEIGTGKIICINSEICYENNYKKLIAETKECTNSCQGYKEFNNICYKNCEGNLIDDNNTTCKCAYKWYQYNNNALNISNIIVCLGEKDECPKDFYPYLDDYNQQCVEDTDHCSSNSKILFNYTCYSRCPNKTVDLDNTCECNIKEGKWYRYTFEGKTLFQCGLSECPKNKVLDNDSQECIYSCENKYYYQGGCYSNCPNNTKLIDKLAKECVKIYPFEELKDLKSLEENIKNNIKIIYQNTTSNGIIYNINNSTMQIYGVNKNKEDKKDVIMRNNLTYIDLSYCLDKLYDKNGLSEDTDIIIVKYDLAEKTNGSTINPVEFKVVNSKTGQEIPLDACDDNSIVISYPLMNILNSFVTEANTLRSLEEENKKNLNLREKFLKGKEIYIDNEEIDSFDLSNKLYTDICYPFKMNGKDLILEDRLNYLYPFSSFCESNCIYNKTDFISERVYCSCNPKDQINFERNLELMNNNPDMAKIQKDQKASILKCLGKISKISKNVGFFYGLFIILAEIAMCILTFLYSYKVFLMKINRKFDIKGDDNINNINIENLESVNLSYRDKNNNKNEEIIKTSERNLSNPPKEKKHINIIEIKEDKKEKRKDTKKKTTNKREKIIDNADIINIKKIEKDKISQRSKEDKLSSNGYNLYVEKSSIGTFKDSEDENIFELIKLESTFLTIDYQKALEKNKAEILIMILTEILDKIYIVKAIWFLQKYAIVSLYVSLYLLWHLLIISFLSLFYNYSNLHKIWIKDNYPNLNFHLSFGFLSCIISFIFYKGLCFLIFNDRKIAELDSIPKDNKNEFNEKYKKMIFWAKIKIIIFYVVVFILCIMFFLYLIAFWGVYIGTKTKLLESYGIALIEVVIIKILYGIVLGILRKVSLTYEIEKLYFIIRILDLYIS